MQNLKFDLPLKVGLVLATLSWLTYVFYDFNIGIFSRHYSFPLIVEDVPAVWGLGFRMAAATIAVIIVVFFVLRREFSAIEATMALRLALLFEALYFASFIGGALNVWRRNYFTLIRFTEGGLPTFVVAILLPIVLIKLFFELNPNKPRKGAVKWVLIYVTTFLFAFWLNNSSEWIGTVLSKGASYLTQYPINLLSFVVTVLGLLLLFLYAADFTSKWSKIGTMDKLNLKKISAIVTLLGLYPLFIFLLWLFFGTVGGWGVWYAWFLGHGYMSFIALPITFITLPLLFRSRVNNESSKFESMKHKTLYIDRKRINSLLFLTQGLGIVFFTIFSLTYYIPIPTTHFLI
jgi:hypothetical protein